MAAFGSNDETFDIITELDPARASRNFRLNFDVYTPRSHFIILSRSPSTPPNFDNLQPEMRKQVMSLAANAVKSLSLREATLSIHRGSWITTKKFHLHICTDVEQYLAVYRRLASSPPMNTWWPNKHFVTKQWKAKPDPNQYEINVRAYPYEKSYQQEEMKAIGEKTRQPVRAGGVSQFLEREVAYHVSKCRIGVVARCQPGSAECLLELTDLLVQLARAVGAETPGEGCQICVDMTGKGYDNFMTRSAAPVCGYLQVSGPVFYKNCPATQRDAWLGAYGRDPELIYT